MPYYGTVGGRRIAGKPDLYQIETVIEKPTPTQAEQHLIVPGQRAGSYLCYFGMHVLTDTIFTILAEQVTAYQRAAPAQPGGVTLAGALAELAQRNNILPWSNTIRAMTWA
ncbi:MAG: hypothetical protein R2932_04205 [Caldilineaceae bacterium]